MELRDYAERVLLGVTLEDKLAPLGAPSDRAPGSPVSAVPGRPPELPLRSDRPRAAFPKALDRDEDRVSALHAFAVHELLALELLAWALLRFPDADPRLRRAWAVTAADEQRHLALYLERLATCGGALGQEPASAFFWDALSGSPDPTAFTVGLALVLEQANLDFARHWGARFAAAGDDATAGVLAQVLDDEIRHVRIGAAQLERERRPGEDAFDAFARTLRFPLTPARARGPEPQRDVRIAAGLTDEFVDRLLVWGMSRGRDPRVFLFDPTVEDSVAGRPTGETDLARDLRAVPMWLAGRDDVVVAPPPRPAHLLSLAEIGIEPPQFVEDPAEIARVGALCPWGWSPRTASALGGRFDPGTAPVHSKAWAQGRAREWLPRCTVAADPDHVGIVCATLDEVRAAAGDRTVWLKAALSTAGTHRMRVAGLDRRAEVWVERALPYGPVVVEPHLDVAAELSVQVEVGDDVRVVGQTRFWARNGVYRGTVVGPADLGLPPEIRRFVHSPTPGAAFGALRDAARFVGEAAAALGFRGPLGVDALVVRTAAGLRLRPISEVNARYTMGRVALALRDRLAPGSVGAWIFAKPGAADVVGTAEVERDGDRLRSGLVPTTDPAEARRVATWLVVDRSWGAVRARAERHGLAVEG